MQDRTNYLYVSLGEDITNQIAETYHNSLFDNNPAHCAILNVHPDINYTDISNRSYELIVMAMEDFGIGFKEGCIRYLDRDLVDNADDVILYSNSINDSRWPDYLDKNQKVMRFWDREFPREGNYFDYRNFLREVISDVDYLLEEFKDA